MASMQCKKPVEQTHTESAGITEKRTTQACFKANNEHPLTSMIKEMANSAFKMFTEHMSQEHHGQNNHQGQHHGVPNAHNSVSHNGQATGHMQQPAQPGSGKGAAAKATKTSKKKDGHGGNLIANIGDQVKNMTKKKDSKKGKRDSASSSSSSSSSDDESNKETKRKNKK